MLNLDIEVDQTPLLPPTPMLKMPKTLTQTVHQSPIVDQSQTVDPSPQAQSHQAPNHQAHQLREPNKLNKLKVAKLNSNNKKVDNNNKPPLPLPEVNNSNSNKKVDNNNKPPPLLLEVSNSNKPHKNSNKLLELKMVDNKLKPPLLLEVNNSNSNKRVDNKPKTHKPNHKLNNKLLVDNNNNKLQLLHQQPDQLQLLLEQHQLLPLSHKLNKLKLSHKHKHHKHRLPSNSKVTMDTSSPETSEEEPLTPNT